jgi:hypothetical protein
MEIPGKMGGKAEKTKKIRGDRHVLLKLNPQGDIKKCKKTKLK